MSPVCVVQIGTQDASDSDPWADEIHKKTSQNPIYTSKVQPIGRRSNELSECAKQYHHCAKVIKCMILHEGHLISALGAFVRSW